MVTQDEYCVPRTTMSKDIKIIVLQRGWVLVGEYWNDGTCAGITSGHVIRRWGTSRGLGELAAGPLENTKIDPIGACRWHVLSEVFVLDTTGGWSVS